MKDKKLRSLCQKVHWLQKSTPPPVVVLVRKVLAIVWWHQKAWQQTFQSFIERSSQLFATIPYSNTKGDFHLLTQLFAFSKSRAPSLLLSSSSFSSGTGVNLKCSSCKHQECKLEDVIAFLAPQVLLSNRNSLRGINSTPSPTLFSESP